MTGSPQFRWISQKRRTKEDRRFITGAGRFVADVRLPGLKHAALVTSPWPAARIRSIDRRAALQVEGVVGIATGAEMAAETSPLQNGLNTPNVKFWPLALCAARYVGDWVAVVVAEDRYIAEDAAELIEIDYEPLPFVIDPETAFLPDSQPVYPDHGSNVLFHRKFVWGPVDKHFAEAAHNLSFRARWGRNSTVPIETFGVVARWDSGVEILDIWASIQMPKFPEHMANALRLPVNHIRAHYDVDVGGSYGVKRGIKHAVVAGWLARRFGCPVRLIEDRLENMSGGDAHGPDRIFDVAAAFEADGTIRSLCLRALDDVGVYPGRAPLQLGKPVGAIVGPYRIESVEYEAISVTTNKTSQTAVRGFGQAPTNVAIETAVDRVAAHLGLDRIEVRRRNLIRADEFPYMIPSGSEYDSGDYHTVLDKTLDLAGFDELVARRDAMRAEGRLAGIGIATCLEPGGGNSAFEPLFNPANDTTTWMESCQIKIDMTGQVTVIIATSSSGQGHQTLVSTVVGEILERDPDTIRVVHADTLSGLPTNSPVASRMAIMLGGAAARAARKIKADLVRIAAHNLGLSPEALIYRDGTITADDGSDRKLTFNDLATIAHRKMHLMPPGMEPGLQATSVMQVPQGGTLPTADGRVQMYPCYSFEAHIPLVEIDPDTGRVAILGYWIGHDCGTVINPDIVRGMINGGIAHGIGAALYEKFEYNEDGQHLSGSFMDYLLPSAHEVPEIHLVEHFTPSPYTEFGQKGAGEAGYLGAPAAIASAVNDALAPLGVSTTTLPMRMQDLEFLLSEARKKMESVAE